jgi:hypothetical protein
VLHFRFDDHGGNDMMIVELMPSRGVAWECVGGALEWIGTRVSISRRS